MSDTRKYGKWKVKKPMNIAKDRCFLVYQQDESDLYILKTGHNIKHEVEALRPSQHINNG